MNALRTLQGWWMAFAHAAGRVNSVIILSILYFVVIGIYAACYRIGLLARRVFGRRGSPDSFWVEKMPEPPSLASLRRQF